MTIKFTNQIINYDNFLRVESNKSSDGVSGYYLEFYFIGGSFKITNLSKEIIDRIFGMIFDGVEKIDVDWMVENANKF